MFRYVRPFEFQLRSVYHIRMFYKKTISNVRADVDNHTSELKAELERTTDVLTVTLVIVAGLAALALVVALTSNGTEIENDG
jgi:hypothetical protein